MSQKKNSSRAKGAYDICWGLFFRAGHGGEQKAEAEDKNGMWNKLEPRVHVPQNSRDVRSEQPGRVQSAEGVGKATQGNARAWADRATRREGLADPPDHRRNLSGRNRLLSM